MNVDNGNSSRILRIPTDSRMVQHIIFDFDGTITEDDTIGNIAQAALQWRRSPEGGGINLEKDWQSIIEAYIQDLAAYDLTQPPEQQRATWEQERVYLHGRRVVEEASLARIQAAGIFTGSSADGRLFQAGRRDRESGRTRIREGFGNYMAILVARNVNVHIVSVNWSASYIKGVLEPWGITSVIANELQVDGSIAAPSSTGPFKALATSSDKLEATRNLLGTMEGQCLCYIGDSTTDLECLGEFGGYAVTSDGGGSLLKALRRLGHRVPHVSAPDDAQPHVLWARDFTEIAAYAPETSNTAR